MFFYVFDLARAARNSMEHFFLCKFSFCLFALTRLAFGATHLFLASPSFHEIPSFLFDFAFIFLCELVESLINGTRSEISNGNLSSRPKIARKSCNTLSAAQWKKFFKFIKLIAAFSTPKLKLFIWSMCVKLFAAFFVQIKLRDWESHSNIPHVRFKALILFLVAVLANVYEHI